MRCATARDAIDQNFVKQKTKCGATQSLWPHLQQCSQCRAYYDQVILMERMVASGCRSMRAPSELELDIVECVISEPVRVDWREKLGSRLQRLLRIRVLVPTTAALLVFVLGGIFTLQSISPGHWTARSVDSRPLEIRVFCHTKDIGGQPMIRSISVDPGPNELEHCPVGGHLLFAYRASKPGFVYGLLVENKTAYTWLPSTKQPMAVTKSFEQLPLPIRLTPEILAERTAVELVFVFCPSEYSTAEVEEMVSAHLEDSRAQLPEHVFIERRYVPLVPSVE